MRVGDEVIATDPQTGERKSRRVEQVFVHQDTVIDLVVDGESISTTEDHPFWSVTDQRFERADELSAGELVLDADGNTITVTGLDTTSAREATAYNLAINEIHTYHVGDTDILVHNTCPVGDGPGANGGYGRGGQKLEPHPDAGGSAHVTFRRDADGAVTHYTEWAPNPRHPDGVDEVKRFDAVGGSHFNKVEQADIPTPHIAGRNVPGGVRPAEPWEIPR